MNGAVKLYELAQARDILDEFLTESEGDVTPELQQLLDQLEGDVKEKVERVALYVRELVATAKAVHEEVEHLEAKETHLLRSADGLKGYLKVNLERLGLTKVQGLLCTVAIQKNSAAAVRTTLEPVELFALDEARPFVKREEKIVYSLDRDAVLTAWKSNQALPAAIAVEHGTHIRIR